MRARRGGGGRCGGGALVGRRHHTVTVLRSSCLLLRVHLLVHLHVAVEVDEQCSVPAAHVKPMKRRGGATHCCMTPESCRTMSAICMRAASAWPFMMFSCWLAPSSSDFDHKLQTALCCCIQCGDCRGCAKQIGKSSAQTATAGCCCLRAKNHRLQGVW